MEGAGVRRLKMQQAVRLEREVTAAEPQRRPKIVLAVHHGFSIRYLLQTDILPTLRASGAELVILSLSDSEHLRKKFSFADVTFEQIPASVGERVQRQGRLQRMLRFVRAYSHAMPVRTTEHTFNIALKDAALRQPSLRTRLNLRLLRGLVWLARRVRWLREGIVSLESRLYRAAEYEEFMRRHRPDLVVTSSPGWFDFDQYILRAARKLGVRTLAVILSWDNTTTRGYPAARVDRSIAWSDVMKWELTALNDVAADSVSVEGVAHFDRYFRPDLDFDRATFLLRLGLDPAKRTILVATKSPNCYAHNPNIAQILAEAIEAGDLPSDCQVLIRVHPLHYRFQKGQFIYEDVLQVYRKLAARHPCIKLNEPDIVSKSVNYDMAGEEITFLSRLLRSTDVLVNIFSTMNIEAAVFDVPMVNVNFDNLPALYPYVRDHRFDIRIDFESDHNQRIVRSGGTKVADTPDALISYVQAYLDDPSLDREGRRRIVDREIGPNRGHAGVTVGKEILAFAKC